MQPSPVGVLDGFVNLLLGRRQVMVYGSVKELMDDQDRLSSCGIRSWSTATLDGNRYAYSLSVKRKDYKEACDSLKVFFW